ncbi:MAG: RNA polymerase subunit alpha domain protein [Planctomycetota bacterium]|nr:MAG: RNA polymerase subunit alpha domain protein [Planctomycetota bacterium]
MSAPATLDIRDLVTGTGAFGPSEIVGLMGQLGSDPASHRDLRIAVKEIEGQSDRSPAASVRLGVGQYLLGRWKDSLQTLKSADGGALALYFQARCHLALGMASDATEHLAHAQESFTAAQKAGYDPTACGVGVAEAQRLAGHVKEAEKTLAKVAATAESSADYWAEKAASGADSGLPLADTIAALEKALALDSSHPAALFAMGVINDRVGNDDEAKICYERAVKRYPTSVGALLNLGILYEDRDDFLHAQQCYKRILQVYPDHPRARLFLKDSSASGNLQLDDQEQKQRDRLEHVLALPVTDFELSVRSRNCLQKMGIHTLGDLARTTEAEILESKNFGETSLVEIKDMLATKGLSLGQLAAAVAAEETAIEPVEPSADEQEVHSLPITELSLSVRARKCTTKLGIMTIGELVRRTAEDLMECKNFGVTSLNEVREKLTERGLKLRGD